MHTSYKPPVSERNALMVRERDGSYRAANEDEIVGAAREVLGRTIVGKSYFSAPLEVKDYLRASLGTLEHEVFAVIFLDAQNGVIEMREMFRGTLNQTSVYPREVAKEALALNAAAVVLAHNHPSGSVQPSRADEILTSTLKSALSLIDVRVLDHVVVCRQATFSFAEKGLL